MRCPTCLFDQKPHTVMSLSGRGTDGQLAAVEFWDEAEGHHIHDPTVSYGWFACSNGHEWKLSHITRCQAAGCDWNLRPETRGQLTAPIPGRPQETIGEFRARKISQWLRIKERIPMLRMENAGFYFGTFTAVDMSNNERYHAVIFGALPYPDSGHSLTGAFIDLTDQEIITYFNGGPGGF